VAGLKPFRKIPENIVEWTKWMREQETGGSVASSTTSTTTVDGTTTTTTTTASTRWVVEDFSGNYILRDADDGKLMRSTGGSATNFTVNAGWLNGENGQVTVMQYGAGTVTVVAGSGVTIRTPSTLVFNEQYGTVTLIQIANNEYVIAGRMAP
jgi:hypothetical protein